MKKLVLVFLLCFICLGQSAFAVGSQKVDVSAQEQKENGYSENTQIPAFGLYSVRLNHKNGEVYAQEPYVDKVRAIGKDILKKNHIKERIQFKVRYYSLEDNACASSSAGTVVINRGLFKSIKNDDELAAIMAHEIGHILDNDDFKIKVARIIAAPILIIPDAIVRVATFHEVHLARDVNAQLEQPYENKADLKGVDLMVNAGYNPVAMITAFDRIAGDGHALFKDHATASKRIENVSNYIRSKYPKYIPDLEAEQDKL